MSASNGSNGIVGKVRNTQESMRTAVEYRFNNPHATWDEIAKRLLVTTQSVYRWRKTEQWEIISREVANQHVADLAPDALAALRKAWKNGNPAGALDVLRSLQLMRNHEVTINHLERDLDAEIEHLLNARVIDAH